MRSIFLLDDNLEVVLLFRTVLTRQGYTIKTATSPLEAVRLIEQGSFDLIITDLKMPEMSGVEFLQKVRASGVTCPAIVISAFPDYADASQLSNLGVRAFLTKPVLMNRLERAVSEALMDQAEVPD